MVKVAGGKTGRDSRSRLGSVEDVDVRGTEEDCAAEVEFMFGAASVAVLGSMALGFMIVDESL